MSRQRFTLVFEGNLRKVAGNPHKIATPYGLPVTVGIGDAFAVRDEMLDALKACVEMFRDENPDDDWTAIKKARAAIAKAEGKAS